MVRLRSTAATVAAVADVFTAMATILVTTVLTMWRVLSQSGARVLRVVRACERERVCVLVCPPFYATRRRRTWTTTQLRAHRVIIVAFPACDYVRTHYWRTPVVRPKLFRVYRRVVVVVVSAVVVRRRLIRGVCVTSETLSSSYRAKCLMKNDSLQPSDQRCQLGGLPYKLLRPGKYQQ